MFYYCPQLDGLSLSEVFLDRRVRSYLPSLYNRVDLKTGKDARQKKTLKLQKKSIRNHKPLPHTKVMKWVLKLENSSILVKSLPIKD